MKDPFDRTKVVLRHLPPALTLSTLMDQIDARFAARYNCVSFRPGKISHKHQLYSRAYIDFKKPNDVVEFAEFFDGHVFVNEKEVLGEKTGLDIFIHTTHESRVFTTQSSKLNPVCLSRFLCTGAQFKTIVEYAPSQRVPKPWPKKDGREGTIYKDPEYLEFLEFLAKPVENLPSAEIQLERREAERAGSAKEPPVVTPLMDFVRQKRAAKSGSQRSSSNGKIGRRALGASPSTSRSTATKRGSEKKRASTSMYVLRDSAKNGNGKEKSTYILVPRREGQQPSDKSISVGAAGEIGEDENVSCTGGTISGPSGSVVTGKKKVLLLKGKEREIAHGSGGASQYQSVTSPLKNSTGSTTLKQNQRREASGKMIRSILSNKEAHQSQSSSGIQSEQQKQNLNLEKEKRPPRSINMRSVLKEHLPNVSQAASGSDYESKMVVDDKINGNDMDCFGSSNDKQEKRSRNKDRPDRGVWTLRRSDGSHASNEFLSSSTSQATQLLSEYVDGISITQQLSVPCVSSKPKDDGVDSEFNNISPCSRGRPRYLDTAVQNIHLGRGGNPPSAYDLPSGHAEMKIDIPSTSRTMEVKTLGRSSYNSLENGSHRHAGRRGPAHTMKDVDSSVNLSEGKPSKRGGATNYGSHEKQVWVQKSGGS